MMADQRVNLPPYGQGGYTEPTRRFDPLMVENGDATSPYYESNSFKKFPVRTTCKTCNLRVTIMWTKNLALMAGDG